MAKTNPAALKKEGETLKALFAKVKKKEHNCAFLLSKDGIVVEAHIKKSPEVLLKAAKKAGGTARGAWGSMTMEGQVIVLDPINDKVPGNLTKLAKKYFSERGMKFRLEIKEPEEGAATKKMEEEQEASTSDTSKTDEKKSDSAARGDPGKKLVDQLAKRQKHIDALLADTENVMHSELVESLRVHERVMGEGKFDNAVDTMHRIEVALKDYATLLAKAAPHIERMKKISPDVEKIKTGGDDEAADAIATAERGYQRALRDREWSGAARFLDTIEGYIEEYSDDTAEPQGDETQKAEAEPELTKEQLTKDVKRVIEVFKLSVAGMDKTDIKRNKDALTGIAGKIKSGDIAGAQVSVAEFGKLTGITPKSPLKPIAMEGGTKGSADNAKNQKKELTKAFADLKPEIKRSIQLANPEHKAEMQKLVNAFGKEMKSSDMGASQATLETFKSQIKTFDLRREEGRTQRKRQFEDIRTRATEIANQLEQMAANRGGA